MGGLLLGTGRRFSASAFVRRAGPLASRGCWVVLGVSGRSGRSGRLGRSGRSGRSGLSGRRGARCGVCHNGELTPCCVCQNGEDMSASWPEARPDLHERLEELNLDVRIIEQAGSQSPFGNCQVSLRRSSDRKIDGVRVLVKGSPIIPLSRGGRAVICARLVNPRGILVGRDNQLVPPSPTHQAKPVASPSLARYQGIPLVCETTSRNLMTASSSLARVEGREASPLPRRVPRVAQLRQRLTLQQTAGRLEQTDFNGHRPGRTSIGPAFASL